MKNYSAQQKKESSEESVADSNVETSYFSNKENVSEVVSNNQDTVYSKPILSLITDHATTRKTRSTIVDPEKAKTTYPAEFAWLCSQTKEFLTQPPLKVIFKEYKKSHKTKCGRRYFTTLIREALGSKINEDNNEAETVTVSNENVFNVDETLKTYNGNILKYFYDTKDMAKALKLFKAKLKKNKNFVSTDDKIVIILSVSLDDTGEFREIHDIINDVKNKYDVDVSPYLVRDIQNYEFAAQYTNIVRPM